MKLQMQILPVWFEWNASSSFCRLRCPHCRSKNPGPKCLRTCPQEGLPKQKLIKVEFTQFYTKTHLLPIEVNQWVGPKVTTLGHVWHFLITKRQKGNFSVSQKTNLKMLIFALAWGRSFLFVFWENWKNQKAPSILTDL